MVQCMGVGHITAFPGGDFHSLAPVRPASYNPRMENYIAVVFGSKEQAIAFHAALVALRLDSLRVKRAGVYARGIDGEVSLVDTETENEGVFDFLSMVSTGSEQEAVDELNEKLPGGSFAVLAYVTENNPAPIDDLAREYGGAVYRRAPAGLESAGYQRFTDSSSL
jgi:hypothetical protein